MIDDLKANIEQAELDFEKLKAQQASGLADPRADRALRKGQLRPGRAGLQGRRGQDPHRAGTSASSPWRRPRHATKQQKALPFQEDLSGGHVCACREISLQRQQLRYQRTLNDLKTFTFGPPWTAWWCCRPWSAAAGTTAQYSVGDAVNPGRSFMKIVDTSSMQLEALASQAETSDMRVGQPATVSLDAFPGLKFPARSTAWGDGEVVQDGELLRPDGAGQHPDHGPGSPASAGHVGAA